MNAGQALGLLAGLGAINALRGGRDGAGPRFTGLLDMIDGGGAGQSGDRFEGGGLLSMLGNLFMKPYEAQQNVERIAGRTSTRDRSSSPRPVLRPDLTDTVPNPFLDVAPVGTGNPLVDRIIQDRKEQVVMDQPVVPSNTTPNLTEAQKEAIVMSQAMPPAAFDYRQFDRSSEPSTLTPEQALSAQGIIANQAKAQSLLPKATAEVPTMGFGKDTLRTDVGPEVTSAPMGLFPRQTMTPPATINADQPNVGSLLDIPSRPPNETQVMLQKLMATVPQGVGELTSQEYGDYILAGGRLPYADYEKTTPEYRATQALMKQYEGFQLMPIDEQIRLINERADILRRETPKPTPFTGPAF